MELVIDPRDSHRTRLVLIDEQKMLATADVVERDRLLQSIVEFLGNHGGVSRLAQLGVVTGGGSFSGVRKAVVIGRTIGYVLQLPVVAYVWMGEEPTVSELRKKGKILTAATYAAEPNITKRKKRKKL